MGKSVRSGGRSTVSSSVSDQRRADPGAAGHVPAPDYTFISGKLVDAATLERSTRIANKWNVPVHEVLLSNGWIRPADYYRELARSCGAEFVEKSERGSLAPLAQTPTPREALRAQLLRRQKNGRLDIAFAPRATSPDEVRRSLARGPGRVSITTPRDLRRTIQRSFADQLTDNAINGLERRYPGESAGQGLTSGQRLALGLIFASIVISVCLAPLPALRLLAALATLFFGLVVALRLTACIHMLAALPLRLLRRKTKRQEEAELPVYTLLVPLFREKAVIADLTRALMRLDYPAAKLDIKLIFEEVDKDTLEAARNLRLPANFDFIIVPDSHPRTKPKALNYALQFARGEYVVIYDAEDRPEPGQLRKALAAFRTGPANLACVQARLTIYNGAENWLTKQFAIEYAALFSGMLPTLQSLGLPIPLGGTSNHFRTSALHWLGAWDAFNVTEDADLGMRLYRHGYVCRMLDSETGEEATCRFKTWLHQRTRWLKGWLQTYFVHMRRPLKLWRQLGTGRFLGFQVMVGGMVFSALAHPVFYILLVVEASTSTLFNLPATMLGLHVWLIALFNVAVGYLAAMTLSLIALRQKGARFVLHILFMPVYWLLISLAAYRALGQLLNNPFHWEKTEHGVSSFAAKESARPSTR